MVNLERLEQQYQYLVGQLRAGQLDQAAFEAATARLRFWDSEGRLWMIGVQTGQWYYYDSRCWRPGTPPDLEQAKTELPAGSKSGNLKIGAILAMMIGVVLLSLLMLPISQAAPGPFPLLAPSPRPPLSDGGQSDGGQADNSGDGEGSAIYGVVTDLIRGQPGAGVAVLVNGNEATHTDTDGRYSVTGLNAGTYTVSLRLNGQGEPAYGPVYVTLDGQRDAVINLEFYSQPLPTDTPQPALLTPSISPAATPAALPDSGQALAYRPLLLMGLGSLLVAAGLALSQFS